MPKMQSEKRIKRVPLDIALPRVIIIVGFKSIGIVCITSYYDSPSRCISAALKALNCLRLGSRIDAVASRLETAVRMNAVTNSMKGVVKGMDKGLASMDVDKISTIMDKFEQQFEDLDVKAAYMDTAMNATTANATPVDQVDDLVKMVADENNLELGEDFSSLLPVGKIKEPKKKEEKAPVEDDLEARLANLRG